MENQQVRYPELEGQLNLLDHSAGATPAVGVPTLLHPAPELPVGGNGAGGRDYAQELMRAIKGSVIHREMTETDLDRIAEGSARRGWLARHGRDKTDKPILRRSVSEQQYIDGFSDWVCEQFNILASFTVAPAVADSRFISSPSKVVAEVERVLLSMPWKHGKYTGYRGRFILVPEYGKSGREVAHVHAVLDSCAVVDVEGYCDEIRGHFRSVLGFSTCEPMRDTNRATLYGFKDTLKSALLYPDAIRIKLSRHRALRHLR